MKFFKKPKLNISVISSFLLLLGIFLAGFGLGGLGIWLLIFTFSVNPFITILLVGIYITGIAFMLSDIFEE